MRNEEVEMGHVEYVLDHLQCQRNWNMVWRGKRKAIDERNVNP